MQAKVQLGVFWQLLQHYTYEIAKVHGEILLELQFWHQPYNFFFHLQSIISSQTERKKRKRPLDQDNFT